MACPGRDRGSPRHGSVTEMSPRSHVNSRSRSRPPRAPVIPSGFAWLRARKSARQATLRARPRSGSRRDQAGCQSTGPRDHRCAQPMREFGAGGRKSPTLGLDRAWRPGRSRSIRRIHTARSGSGLPFHSLIRRFSIAARPHPEKRQRPSTGDRTVFDSLMGRCYRSALVCARAASRAVRPSPAGCRRFGARP